MPNISFIGDVHSCYDEYLPLLEGNDCTLQVGDLGFKYRSIAHLDPAKHRAIAGNHDNYDSSSLDYFKQIPIFLDDFGIHEFPGIPPIFYVRGGFSLDHKRRKAQIPPTWFEEEELTYQQLEAAIDSFAKHKPQIVVTHECPDIVTHLVANWNIVTNFGYPPGHIIRSKTAQALTRMFGEYQPEYWIFGHYHRKAEFRMGETNFVCLDMMRCHGDIGYENKSDVRNSMNATFSLDF